MTQQEITQEVNKRVLCVTMGVATVFLVLRSAARWLKTNKLPFEAEDIASMFPVHLSSLPRYTMSQEAIYELLDRGAKVDEVYIALSSFIIQCCLYMAAIPTLYKVLDIQAGRMTPYPSLVTDLPAMLKEFLSVLIFFWLTLWAVKASLLLMFKKLTQGLPFYERIWWYVMVFSIVTFVGCVISDFTSCSSFHAWFTAGECFKHRDATAKAISLWYALGVDLVTDLFIMAIPIRLLWNLRISMREKLGLAIIFTVGIITMIFAIVRTVSLEGTTSGGQVSTQWLILWGAIEGMVAIIVGCLPSFAIFIRSKVEASRIRRNSITNPLQTSMIPPPTYATKFSEFDSFQSESTKSRMHIESLQLDDFEVVNSSLDGDSRHSLVYASINERDVRIARGWSQKWHGGVEMERVRVGAARMEDGSTFI